MINLVAEVNMQEKLSRPGSPDEIYVLALNAPGLAQKVNAGQFIMINVNHEHDSFLPRPFSVYGAEGDEIMLLYRVKGIGTRRMASLQSGDRLPIWGPLGRGFDLNLRSPLLIAGGMGLPPLLCAAMSLGQIGSQVSLLLGLSSMERYGFLLEQIEAACSLRQVRLFISEKMSPPPADEPSSVSVCFATEDGSWGESPCLVTDLMAPLNLQDFDGILACGPLGMLKQVAAEALRQNAPCQVCLETPMACGVGACLGCAVPVKGGGYLRACQEGPVFNAYDIDWSRV